MKLTKSLLLIVGTWLTITANTVYASTETCGIDCVYASSIEDSANISALSGDTNTVLGQHSEPVDSGEGITLASTTSGTASAGSYITLGFTEGISSFLYITGNNAILSDPDERFNVWVSSTLGGTYTPILNPASGIDYFVNNAVELKINIGSGVINYVRLESIEKDNNCIFFGPAGCQPWTNSFEVVEVAGTAASAVVPVPATVWLFGSGLLGLIATAKRRRS